MIERIAEDVAEMQSEIAILRNENEQLRQRCAIAEAERSRLQIDNVALDAKSRDYMTRAVRMETIMKQVSAGLIAGLNEMQQDREVARAIRQRQQEDDLGVSEQDRPAFLRRPSLQTHAVDPETRTTAEERSIIAEAVRPLERPAYPALRPGKIDHSLASRDPRLPAPELESPENRDQRELGEIGTRITSTR